MKHLKLFEAFREEDIQAICKRYGIENYTINEDGSIDVDDNVYMMHRQIDKLPLKFRNVTGSFNCARNKLTTLKGCPISVDDSFYCYNNELTSLEGGPESIGGDFDCCHNKIVTFEHLPYSIGGDFLCFGNPIYHIWKLFKDYYKIEFLNDCDAIREPDDDSGYPIIILDRLNFFLEEIGKKPNVTKVKGYKCI